MRLLGRRQGKFVAGKPRIGVLPIFLLQGLDVSDSQTWRL